MTDTRRPWPFDHELKTWPTAGEAVIWDTEFTSWEGAQAAGFIEPWQHREIIQIGAAIVDCANGFTEKGLFQVLIKPTANPRLSDYIQDLTGITQAQLDLHGRSLTAALVDFQAFIGPARPLLSHGGDGRVLMETCAVGGVAQPIDPHRFWDFRPMLSRRMGLKTFAVSSALPLKAGLDADGKDHDALHDVRNLVRVLRKMRRDALI